MYVLPILFFLNMCLWNRTGAVGLGSPLTVWFDVY